MLKKLTSYSLLLLITDQPTSLIINFVLNSPGELILISALLRIVFIFFLFLIISLAITYFILNKKVGVKLIVITTLIVYLLIPLIIFLLKSNDSSLLTVFLDLHLKYDLFSLTLLPFIIASIITFCLSNKYKLLKSNV
jgi:hypothetical protein